MNYLSLCCIARNEHSYIREWLDYHRVVGVEKFYVYDDGEEGDEPLEQLLAPYVAEGVVEVRRCPGTARKQMLAYEDCFTRDAESSFWIGFIDVDEFLVPKSHRDLRELLREREAEAGFAVNWLVFGSSRHETRPAGLVTESYLWRSKPRFKGNRHIKTILQPKHAVTARNPHAFEFRPGHRCVNERGKPVDDAWCKNATETVQLNHYFTKSRQEFMEKVDKGRAEGGRFTKRYVGTFSSAEEMYDFFQKHCTVVEDRLAMEYASALRRGAKSGTALGGGGAGGEAAESEGGGDVDRSTVT